MSHFRGRRDNRPRGGGPPPGLRGREIGMYYKNLQSKKREAEKDRIDIGPNVSVPPAIVEKVSNILKTVVDNKEEVSNEFMKQFKHLLTVNFEEFLEKARNFEIALEEEEEEAVPRNIVEKPLLESRIRDRKKLPAMAHEDEILESIKQNQVVLVVGDTGCGKTTQVPQMILDDFLSKKRGKYKIVCTQPRRISAITVAERVAYERAEKLGLSVGYQIRLDCVSPVNSSSITYCTTGILLQKMQGEPLLRDINAIILDEIHERSVETDLLMALLKKVLPYRPDLRVILMSATVREEDFWQYFGCCHIFRIKGTLFPVEVLYLEDIISETKYTKFKNHSGSMKQKRSKHQRRMLSQYEEYQQMISPYLVSIGKQYDKYVIDALRCSDSEGCDNLDFLEYLIFYICKNKPPGAILVFLPGYDQISKLYDALEKPKEVAFHGLQHSIQVYPLHSMMPTINQKNVFLPAPKGMRKVILSTTIAETSVTIDDVVYVINTGRTKRSTYDVTANLQTLEEQWVTIANTKQRKGRAGRVQPGICYNLFTRAREQTMKEIPLPEILCSKLESIVLNLKLLHINDVCAFLNTLLTPPDSMAIQNGVKLLKRIDALDDKEFITPLGMHLARLPIDPQTAKMILMAALFRCIDPITSVGATLSFKSPFYTPLGLEHRVDATKKNLSSNIRSDHLLYHNVIFKYRYSNEHGRSREFCYDHFLSISTLKQLENMKQQFTQLLQNARFLDSGNCADESANVNSNNIVLLRGIIGAGLYPNMAYLRKVRTIKNHVIAIHSMSTPEDRRVKFHPSSINHGESSFDSKYFVYFRKQKSSDVFLMEATMIFPMALLIFGDKVCFNTSPDGISYISVGNAYNFKCDKQTADLVFLLRQRLEWLMQKKALSPSPIQPNSSEEKVIKAIQTLLSLDEIDFSDDDFDSDDSV